MNQPASSAEIITELKKRGHNAKLDHSLVTVDKNPEPGVSRTYTVELVAGYWQIDLSEVAFDADGEDNEEQQIIAEHRLSAIEIADAIDAHEAEC